MVQTLSLPCHTPALLPFVCTVVLQSNQTRISVPYVRACRRFYL
jgi:hypothetical protein